MGNLPFTIVGKWNKNKYRVLKKVGQGGCGTIYKVKDQRGNTKAIKVSDDVNAVTREFHMMKKLSDLRTIPNVYEIDDYVIGHKTFYFFVMEFIEGKNLKEIIRKSNIDEREVVGVGIVIGEMMKEIGNKGYAYTDIKLENILIDTKRKRMIFIDFSGVVDKEWGLKEYTPAYNMISWGMKRNYNHVDGTIFAITMVIISMMLRKEFNPLTNNLSEIVVHIKKMNILLMLKKVLIKGLNLGYKNIDEYQADLKRAIICLQSPQEKNPKRKLSLVNIFFIFSASLFIFIIFWGINIFQ